MSNVDTLQVKENEDGTFTMEWDPKDPLWSWLNAMTEEEISKIISDYSQQVINDETINSIIADDSLTPE
tara:strand:+ start:2164 stop:2370 length:207 start_codon:yes stop_codon:yes gene_type:complete